MKGQDKFEHSGKCFKPNVEDEEGINRYILIRLNLFFNNDVKCITADSFATSFQGETSVQSKNDKKGIDSSEKSSVVDMKCTVEKSGSLQIIEINNANKNERYSNPVVDVHHHVNNVGESQSEEHLRKKASSQMLQSTASETKNALSMNELSTLSKFGSDIFTNMDAKLKKTNLSELLGDDSSHGQNKNERWKRYIKHIELFLDVHTIINLSQTCKFFYKRKYKLGNNRLVFNNYLGYNPKILYEYVMPRIYKHLHRSVRRRMILDFSLCTLIKDTTMVNLFNQIYKFDSLNTKHLFIYNIQEIYLDYCHHLTDKTLEVLAQMRLPFLKTLSIKCVRNKYLTCAPLAVMLKKSNWPVFTNFCCSFSNAWLEPIFIVSNFIINRANNENHIIYHRLKNLQKSLQNMKSFESLSPQSYEKNDEVEKDGFKKQGGGGGSQGSCLGAEERLVHDTGIGFTGPGATMDLKSEEGKRGDMHESGKSNLLNLYKYCMQVDPKESTNCNMSSTITRGNVAMNYMKNRSLLNSETEMSISQSETNHQFNLFHHFIPSGTKNCGYGLKTPLGLAYGDNDDMSKNGLSGRRKGHACSSTRRANGAFVCEYGRSQHDVNIQQDPLLCENKDLFDEFMSSDYTTVNRPNQADPRVVYDFFSRSRGVGESMHHHEFGGGKTKQSNTSTDKKESKDTGKEDKANKKQKEKKHKLEGEKENNTEDFEPSENKNDNMSEETTGTQNENSKRKIDNLHADEKRKSRKSNEEDHKSISNKRGGKREGKKKGGNKKSKTLTAENIFCMNILHNNVNTFDEDEEEEEEDENGEETNQCRCNGKSCIYFTEEINFKCDCEDCPFAKGYKNYITVDDPYIQSHFVKPKLDILGSWGSKCFLESIGLDIYVKGYSVALKNENIKICVKLMKKIQEELYELSKSEKYMNNNLVYLLRDKGSELLSNTPLTIETDDIGGIDIWTLPISLAISKKNRYLFYLVLKGGAKIDVWDYLGKSPLYIACENECKEFVEVLLEEKRKRRKRNNIIEYHSNSKGGINSGSTLNESENNKVSKENALCIEKKEDANNEKKKEEEEEVEVEAVADDEEEGKEKENNEEKEKEKNKTICISPYGNTCESHSVIFPFDLESAYIPLNIAIKKKNFAIVDLLVKSGEPLNIKCPFVRDYKSPLYLACENNISEIIQLLLENKADPNWTYHNKFTPIMLAYNLNKAWVNHFLDAGAGEKLCDRHILTEVLSCAIFKNDLITVQLLLKKYPQLLQKGHKLWSLPFIQAAKLERLNIMKFLCSLKMEVLNQLDFNHVYSPIHVAAEEGKEEVVKFLLENGANVNLTNKFHQNALHIACLENQVRIVEILLQYDIDVNCKDNINGECPLMICIRTRNETLALMILNRAKNINYNLTNIHGETSLLYSIFYGLYKVADLLMKRRADVAVRDVNGDKSYNVACERILSHKTYKKVLRKFLRLYRAQNKNFMPKKTKPNRKNRFYQSYQSINQGLLSIFRLNKKRKKNKNKNFLDPDMTVQ